MRSFYLLITLWYFTCSQCYAQQWKELGAGSNALNCNNFIGSICTDTGGIIYVTGGFTDSLNGTAKHAYVAKWDGKIWSRLSNEGLYGPDSIITSMILDKEHNLYICGRLRDTNGYCYVARWNGAKWSELGTGNNALKANNHVLKICAGNNGHIYAGGIFNDSNCDTCGLYCDTCGYNYVAEWDGTTWIRHTAGIHALNMKYGISSLCVGPEGYIYAGGQFSFYTSGGWSSVVEKWDGTQWNNLSAANAIGNLYTPTEGLWTIQADTVGNVYAGGYFTDDKNKYYLAKWDGNIWSKVGDGNNALNINEPILATYVLSPDNIYIGGAFTDSGNTYIAKWDGTSWGHTGKEIRPFLNGSGWIYTIAGDEYGNIYAAGELADSSNYFCSEINSHGYVAKYGDSMPPPPVKINIYPNPAHATVNISASNTFLNSRYSIYDAIGRYMLAGTLLTNLTPVDISKFVPGMYFIKIGDNAHAVYKLVKE